MTSYKNIALVISFFMFSVGGNVYALPGQEAHGINDFALVAERLNQARACQAKIPSEGLEYLKDFTEQDEKIVVEITSKDEVTVSAYTIAYKLNSLTGISFRILKVTPLEAGSCDYARLQSDVTSLWTELMEKSDPAEADFKYSEMWSVVKIVLDGDSLQVSLKNSMSDEVRSSKKIKISDDYSEF